MLRKETEVIFHPSGGSETFSDNLAMVSIHGKSQSICRYGGNYFRGVDLEDKKHEGVLRRNSDLANLQDGRQQSIIICEAGQRSISAPTRGGTYKPGRAWRWVRDFKVESASFPESSRVIKLMCPDEKPSRPGCGAAGLLLAACV